MNSQNHEVSVLVNENPVSVVGPRIEGRMIKQAAIDQGVKIRIDFILSEEQNDRKFKIIGDADVVTVNKNSRFHAVAPDDNSEASLLKTDVADAIEGIKATFPGKEVIVSADADGGASVIVEDIDLGMPFDQEKTWFGFRIGFQYPHGDIYPHFVRNDLKRKNASGLGPGLTPNHNFLGRNAIQISRRSNYWDPTRDTAALKLLKVIEWLRRSQ